jgi:hypothetical protein
MGRIFALLHTLGQSQAAQLIAASISAVITVAGVFPA